MLWVNMVKESCYFCDFNELQPHLHHIIRKSDKGKDDKRNLLPLCPNHHYLIHRRVYILGYNPRQKFYYLINTEDKSIIIPPTERQRHLQRELPLSSIRNNKKLTIEGNLNQKGVIKVKDLRG